MGELLDKVREYLKRYYPADPIRITVSKFKFIFLLLLLIIGSSFLYLRYQNAEKLEVLIQKHTQIKKSVQQYFRNMSGANTDSMYVERIRSEIYKNQRQLIELEEKIDNIRSFWFLD